MSFYIRVCDYATQSEAINLIRKLVFIDEQGIPEDQEWDEQDKTATFVLAFDAMNNPIGTARLINNKHIGRMAVLPQWRHQGIGTTLLKALLAIAGQSGVNSVQLSAQTSAIDFYTKNGFTICSDIYEEVGIPHQSMTYQL